MKVLMFGWEFPPKIYGGLAVASYGITKGLSVQGDVETIFCMPKPTGEEEGFLKIVGMNQVPIVWRDANYDYLITPPIFQDLARTLPQFLYSILAIISFNIFILAFYSIVKIIENQNRKKQKGIPAFI